MATPDWFDPVTIGSSDIPETLIGGCMGTYNPINEALKETRRLYERYPICSVISIGCGKHAAHQLREDTPDGLNGALISMIHDCDLTADGVHNRFLRMPQFQSIYQRFSVDEEMINIKITDWSKKWFSDISAHGEKYKEKGVVDAALDIVVINLRGESSHVLPTVQFISEFDPQY
jgi:hypothetical protein